MKDKEITVYVASSYNERSNKCGYGVKIYDNYENIADLYGYLNESENRNSYQVGGYLIGVIKGIDFCLKNDYEKIKILSKFEGASKYTKSNNYNKLKTIVRKYIDEYRNRNNYIIIDITKINTNSFIEKMNYKQALTLARNICLLNEEKIGKYHKLYKEEKEYNEVIYKQKEES